jgi:NAD(P)-dependent dehydrogenase (short-subunit alcohol dehydrogenase family)
MNKYKKVVFAGAAAALAGVGLYQYIRSKQNALPAEIWTNADIPDLTGKVIIVTGANSGIGYEAAKEFARKGAQTILACRSLEKAQAAQDQILTEIPNARVDRMKLDLASLESVHKFADQFKIQYERLDVLLNNAGIMRVPYSKTVDGFESQLGTNHLGHFALTGHLLETLLNTPGARVVNISSIGHHSGEIDFDNLMYDGGGNYDEQAAYGRSKLANLLFTYELDRKFKAHGIDAIAVAAHPGISNTDLGDHKPIVRVLRPLIGWILQSAAMGALPGIRAAVDPDVNGGQYYGPSGDNEYGGYPVLVDSSQASHNLDDARRLWEVSETLTGVHYLSSGIEVQSEQVACGSE